MLIITGTGRSGTGTLARLFGGHHEYRAVYLLEKYFRNPECYESLRHLETRISAMQDLHQGIDRTSFVDSSNLYIHFLDALYYLNPEARFIICTRNGKDFVRSGITRGWHHHHAPGTMPPPHDPFHEKWHLMSPLQRNAWIWTYRNNLALKGLETIPDKQKFPAKIEDCSSPELLHSLEQFAGIRAKNISCAQTRFNANPYYTFPSPGEWSESMNHDFDEIAGEMMWKLGYGAADPGSKVGRASRLAAPRL